MSSDSINVARLKKGSDVFEIVIDPDKAVQARHNPALTADALSYPKIFSDAKKGMQASEDRMKYWFKTSDPIEVAKIIIKEGNIQVTAEYRQKMIEQKKKQLIDRIHKNGVDPRTNAPHPVSRVEAALQEAKIKIDEFKSVDVLLKDALKKLQPIIPIKFVKKEIEIVIPAAYAAKAYPTVKMLGKIMKESWNSDGSWTGLIEIPGGMEQECYDKLNSITHGELQAKVVSIR
ncbi:ribosome assembly factor SBDS [Candidatus Woesearchaeota archaeon]|nr:ribosome assembly factor SBDS [Candidatus Woesearchaeota archaeon]MBW3005304.1 ribosome assembly factor SBDS [Candidatus Woesearchaeota archaeon]